MSLDEEVDGNLVLAEALKAQLETEAGDLHDSVQASVGLIGELSCSVAALTRALLDTHWSLHVASEWWTELHQACQANKQAVQKMALDNRTPLNYYAVFHNIQQLLPQGIFGTMEVGPGFAIACAVWAKHHAPGKRVICVEGDSAFGFSGTEMETMIRYQLPIILIVVNNNGIYGGVDEATWKALREDGDLDIVSPPTCLSVNVRYERMMNMFGQAGHFCSTIPELQQALTQALKVTDGPSLLNIAINPSADRKPQTFTWLTASKL